MKLAPPVFVTAPANPIRLSVLGGFGMVGLRGLVDRAGEKRAHVRALLAIVGSSHEGVQRDELLEALWPRQSEAAARNRLYHTMHLARQSLSDLAWPDKWLSISGGRVQLDARVHCDARELITAANGQLAQLDDGALLDFIDEFSGDWAPDVEAGGLGTTLRAQVRASYAQLLHEAAVRQEPNADTPLRRRLLKRILRFNATDEWACAQLMQLDLDAGRPHAVLRTFEAASKALVEQLGLRPSARLSAIAAGAAGVLNHAAASRIVDREPAGLLLGREALVKQLVDAMNAGPGIWNLVGLSGVGKTSLMREVSRRVGPSRVDGVRFVSLGDAAADESATVATTRLARIEDQGGLGAAERLKHFMGSRDALLVIDDLDAALSWRDLIEIAPSMMTARVVWISYTPIATAACRLVLVPPLETAEAGVSSVRARESVAAMLFQMRRPRVDALPASDAEWALILRLVARLDGMPLAIELAAACTATMTPGEILQRIDQGTALVATRQPGHGETAPRHRSIDAALAMSIDRLGLSARRAFLAAAVFSGRFAVEAFRAVAAAVGLPPNASCEAALLELVSAGLVVSADEAGGLRMLHLPRAYARRKAAEEGVWSAIEQARIAQVVEGLERLACSVESRGYTAWMKSVRELHDDAFAILSVTAQADEAMFLRLVLPLAHSWSLRALGDTGLVWVERAIDVARRRDDARAELDLSAHAAVLFARQFRSEDAVRLTESAYRLITRVDSPELVSYFVCAHALCLMRVGRRQEAIDIVSERLAATPPESPGYWMLQTRALTIRHPQAIAGSAGPDWPLGESLRVRYAGSRLWPLLLGAMADFCVSLSSTARLRIAQQLVVESMAIESSPALHYALGREAIALLHVGRDEDALRRVIDAYQLGCAAGREDLAFTSSETLCQCAWQAGNLPVARQWLIEMRRLADINGAAFLHSQVKINAVAIAVLAGDHAGACEIFQPSIVDRQSRTDAAGVLLGIETEVGALLAGAIGADELAKSLKHCLGLISHAGNHYPLCVRFRLDKLGLDMRPYRAAPALASEVQQAAKLANEALRDLFERAAAIAHSKMHHPEPAPTSPS